MKKSLQQYRRLGALGYAQWICKTNGVEFSDNMIKLMDNHTIHAHVSNMLANPVEEINSLVQEELPSPFPAEIQQYDSLTVVELKTQCKEQGLPVYGTKAELVLRLKQNDAGVTDGPTEEVAPEETPDAPTEEVAVTNGSEMNEKTSSDEQEPIIEE
tara:strand:- start:219 stop:689 length:471 start_codon:yes stop_codon:yes gene_type:complete